MLTRWRMILAIISASIQRGHCDTHWTFRMLLLPVGRRSCFAIGRDIFVRIEGQVVHLEGLVAVGIMLLKSAFVATLPKRIWRKPRRRLPPDIVSHCNPRRSYVNAVLYLFHVCHCDARKMWKNPRKRESVSCLLSLSLSLSLSLFLCLSVSLSFSFSSCNATTPGMLIVARKTVANFFASE